SIEQIMRVREKIENAGFDMAEIIQPLRFQFDLNLGRLVSVVVKDEQTNLEKNLHWIKEHLFYFDLIYKHLKEQEKALKDAILKLENELKNRGLEKRVEKLKTQFKDKQC
ncbi:DUF115 domain-containing protein, partial [Campylobacter upsaliensis]|nr:DUF115 domain-containing protein [Campylobacter upsaliensis]